MYLHGLRALALDPSLIMMGISAFANMTRGGGAANAPSLESPTYSNVNTNSVLTTVSPQISPVFVQQQQPQNSAVNAATQQIAPAPQTVNNSNGLPTAAGPYAGGTPMTGAIPGVDYASGYTPTGTPLFPSTQNAGIPKNVMLAAGGLLLAAFLLKRGKGASVKGKRRGSMKGRRRRAK